MLHIIQGHYGSGSSSSGSGSGGSGSGTVTTSTATFTPDTATQYNNPERGLYGWPASPCYLQDFTLSELQGLRTRSIPLSLGLAQMDLSGFITNSTLTTSLLNSFTTGFGYARSAGVKLIVLPIYNFQSGGSDASLSVIQSHLSQLTAIFAANQDVILCVKMGLLGDYGEWHDGSTGGAQNQATKLAVMQAFMAAVPSSIQVLARYPMDLATWYPNVLTLAQWTAGLTSPTNQSRLGSYDDGYLADSTMGGTFSYRAGTSTAAQAMSTAQLEAYSQQLSQLNLNGGEVTSGSANDDSDSGSLTNGALYGMGFLNSESGSGPQVVAWDSDGNIANVNRLYGYRFQLDSMSYPSSTIAPGGTVQVLVNMRNTGYARIPRQRQLVVTLKNTTTSETYSGNAGDLRLLPPQGSSSTTFTANITIPSSATAGNYTVLLSAPDINTSIASDVRYAVQFANANAGAQAWNATTALFSTGATVPVAVGGSSGGTSGGSSGSGTSGVGTGHLTVTLAALANQNVTTGTIGWLLGSDPAAMNTMAGGVSFGFTSVGTALTASTQAFTNLTYSNGTSPSSGSVTSGMHTLWQSNGNGVKFTATVGTSLQYVYVPFACYAGTMTVTASISDGSFSPVTNTYAASSSSTGIDDLLEFAVQAGSAGATFSITLTQGPLVVGGVTDTTDGYDSFFSGIWMANSSLLGSGSGSGSSSSGGGANVTNAAGLQIVDKSGDTIVTATTSSGSTGGSSGLTGSTGSTLTPPTTLSVASTSMSLYNFQGSWSQAEGGLYNGFSGLVTNGARAHLQAAIANLTGSGLSVNLALGVWMIGNNDQFDAASAARFPQDNADFLTRVRVDFPMSATPWVQARVGTTGTGSTTIRNAQDALAAADPLVKSVNTDSYPRNSSDNLHWEQAGLNALGATAYSYGNWVTPASKASVVFVWGDSQANGTADNQSSGGYTTTTRVKIWNGANWVTYNPGVTGSAGTTFGGGAYSTGISCELGIANAFLAANSSGTLYIVKEGIGGSYMTRGPINTLAGPITRGPLTGAISGSVLTVSTASSTYPIANTLLVGTGVPTGVYVSAPISGNTFTVYYANSSTPPTTAAAPAFGTAATYPYIAPTTPTVGAVTATWSSGWGTSDDTNNFIAYMKTTVTGGTYVIPPGTTINHMYALGTRDSSGQFAIPNNVTLIVKGVTFNALGPDYAMYWQNVVGLTIIGDASTNIGSANPGTRGSSYFVNGITLQSCTNVRFFDGKTNGANAAGVYMWGCTDCYFTRWTVLNSLADGFHITGSSTRCYTYDCIASNTGDDLFPIIDYASDTSPCTDCGHIRPTGNGNTNGRGAVVLGGVRCFVFRPTIDYTSAAGVYIGAENNGDFSTRVPVNCWIDSRTSIDSTSARGAISRANYSTTVDHGAVLILDQYTTSSSPVGNFAVTVGDLNVTQVTNGRPIAQGKNGNTGGLMDGSLIHDVTGSGTNYYTAAPYTADSQITTHFNVTPTPTTGLTFDNCTTA